MGKRISNIFNSLNRTKNIRFIILFACVIFVSTSLIGCNKTVDNKIPMSSEQNQINNLTASEESLRSESVGAEEDTSDIIDENEQEIQRIEAVAMDFATAYFSQNLEREKQLLAEGVEAEAYETNIWEQITDGKLKWNAEDLGSKKTIEMQYEFKESEDHDSYDYLGMELQQVDDEWEITAFYLEK